MFFFKKLEKVVNNTPVDILASTKNVPYVFDSDTLSIIDKMLIKNQIAVEVINDISDDKFVLLFP